jgi:hypothetical protein
MSIEFLSVPCLLSGSEAAAKVTIVLSRKRQKEWIRLVGKEGINLLTLMSC